MPRLRRPKTRIFSYEAGLIDLELADECTIGAFIAIDRLTQTLVRLRQDLDMKGGELDPHRVDFGALPDGEGESPDRKEVGRRTESKIDIDAAGKSGGPLAVHGPRAIRRPLDGDCDRRASDHPPDAAPLRFPPLITDYLVVEPARDTFVCDEGDAGKSPRATDARELAELVAGEIQTAPKHDTWKHPAFTDSNARSIYRPRSAASTLPPLRQSRIQKGACLLQRSLASNAQP